MYAVRLGVIERQRVERGARRQQHGFGRRATPMLRLTRRRRLPAGKLPMRTRKESLSQRPPKPLATPTSSSGIAWGNCDLPRHGWGSQPGRPTIELRGHVRSGPGSGGGDGAVSGGAAGRAGNACRPAGGLGAQAGRALEQRNGHGRFDTADGRRRRPGSRVGAPRTSEQPACVAEERFGITAPVQRPRPALRRAPQRLSDEATRPTRCRDPSKEERRPPHLPGGAFLNCIALHRGRPPRDGLKPPPTPRLGRCRAGAPPGVGVQDHGPGRGSGSGRQSISADGDRNTARRAVKATPLHSAPRRHNAGLRPSRVRNATGPAGPFHPAPLRGHSLVSRRTT